MIVWHRGLETTAALVTCAAGAWLILGADDCAFAVRPPAPGLVMLHATTEERDALTAAGFAPRFVTIATDESVN